MPTITQLMDADVREIVGRVEIVYSDLIVDPTIAATATATGRYTYPSQVFDQKAYIGKKWFTMFNNKLDGTFYPMPSSDEYQIGWWDPHLSDVNGDIATPATLLVTFAARHVSYLEVSGDDYNNVYPVDFTINLYDEFDAVLHTEIVTNNNSVFWYTALSATFIGVTKVSLTVTKINKAQHVARILEFFTVIKEIYEGDDIQSINLHEEVEYISPTGTLGTVTASELDIALSNESKKFSRFDTTSPLYSFLKRNRRIRAWLGVVDTDVSVKWEMLGTFWTIHWNVPEDSMVAFVVARDSLELMRNTQFSTSIIYYDKSLYYLFETILRDYGLGIQDYEIDPELDDIILPIAWFNSGSHRAALQKLVDYAPVRLFITRLNKVRVLYVPNLAAAPSVYTFKDSTSIIAKEFPLAWIDSANYIEVKQKSWSLGPEQVVYANTQENLVIPTSEYVTTTYVYGLDKVPVNNAAISIVAPVTVSVHTFEAYTWGAVVTYYNADIVDATVVEVSIVGKTLGLVNEITHIAKNDEAIAVDGFVKLTIDHDFVQTSAYAQALANSTLGEYKNTKYHAKLDTRGHIALIPTDKVNIEGLTEDYMLIQQSLSWDGSLRSKIELKLLT